MSPTRLEELLGRYRAVDRSDPKIDRPRVEYALARHLAAAGYPGFPVRWLTGVREGLELIAKDRHLGRVRKWAHRLDPIRRPPALTRPTDLSPSVGNWMVMPGELYRTAWTVLDREVLGPGTLDPYPPHVLLEQPRSAALGGAWVLACGADRVPIFEPLIDAFEAGLWVYWVLQDEILALPLPRLRSLQGWLHAEDGPAVSWPGGEEEYWFDGVRMSRSQVMDFDRLDAADIQAIENVEVRRVLIRRYGQERFLIDAGAKVLSEDGVGTLFRLELSGDEPIVQVRVLNWTPEPDGTRKPYFLRVPPWIFTPREAVAWTFRLSAAQYAPSIET